jgi:pantetheine-phosphate adenylyltransferase
MSKIIAVYAGSFDPVTLGHEDLIHRASQMFDVLWVAIGVNSSKKPMFSEVSREEMLTDATRNLGNVWVTSFSGLLVNFCKDQGIKVIVRGLRAVSDFEYELSIAHNNATQAQDIQTIFLPTQPQYSFVASSAVREIARHGGNLQQYVNPSVEKKLRDFFSSTGK